MFIFQGVCVTTALRIHEAHHYGTLHDTPVPATSENQSINRCEILTGMPGWIRVVRRC